jgi:hypothetical protein
MLTVARAGITFVAQCDDRERPARLLHPLDRLESREHAEHAVEAAAVRDGVEVRSGPELPRAGVLARTPRDQVAVGIDLDVEAGLLAPARDELVRAILAVAPADAVCARCAADREDRLEAFEEPHRATLPSGRSERHESVTQRVRGQPPSRSRDASTRNESVTEASRNAYGDNPRHDLVTRRPVTKA